MTALETTPWADLIGPVALALALVLLPGLALTSSLGIRGVLRLTLAPATSVALIGIGAVALNISGRSWSLEGLLLVTLVLCLPALIITVVVRGASRRRRPFRSPLRQRGADGTSASAGSRASVRKTRVRSLTFGEPSRNGSHRSELPWLLGGRRWEVPAALAALAGAALLWVRHLHNMLGRPDAISQTFDNIFHLNAVRYIVQSGNGSSLTLGAMFDGGSKLAFYPGAWHDLVSLIVMCGFPIELASNAVMFSVMSVIWTSSLLSLVWSMGLRRPEFLLSTGVLGASFPAFPLLLADFGVLYPNLLGLAIVPSLAALTICLVRSRPREVPLPPVLVLGLVVGLGLALAHPNAALTFVVIAVSIFAAQFFRHLWRREWWRAVIWAAVTGCALVIARRLWIMARPPFDDWQWPPVQSSAQAIGEALMQAPMGRPVSWLLAALVVAGVVVAVRRKRDLWLLIAAGALTFLWVVASAWPLGADRFFWVWPWYSDSYRLAAALPIAAVPLAVLGFGSAARGAHRLISQRRPRPVVGVLCSLIFLTLLVGTTQRSAALNWAVDHAKSSYAMTPEAPLLSSDEAAVLEDLEREVPTDAVIVTDPWNGSSLAYGLTGRRTTTTQPLYDLSPQMVTLAHRLDQAGEDPAVCVALDDLHARYALSFGDPEINGSVHDWEGFDGLDRAPGFELVSRHGNAALYRITACG